MRKLEIIGKRFGRLVVLSEASSYISPTGSRRRKSNCLCDCGHPCEVHNESLTSGHTTSCGCVKVGTAKLNFTRHGFAGSPTYQSWCSMTQRCSNKTNPAYPKYGGRGISVCEQWRKFENFVADMGIRPEQRSLGRIDNNGNYTPENCEWQTPIQQARNTRRNRVLTVNGMTGCVSELCEHFKVSRAIASDRLNKLGWTPERTFGVAQQAIAP